VAKRRLGGRRELLGLAVAAGATLLVGCAPPTPPAAPPAARLAAPSPTTADPPRAADKLGRSLIGRLEGPEVELVQARYPTSFREAPELAELVRMGKLPPVAERIGQDPLVIRPVHEIGKYGGTMRRAFIGPGDRQNANRFAAGPDNLLYFDYQWKNVVPNIARGFALSDGGRVTELFLRRGMKWSDGAPFTADDIMFWYEDLYRNEKLVPTPHSNLMINGKPATVVKVDTYTVRFVFPDPAPLFPEILAGWTGLGGLSLEGLNAMGGYAPGHYLRQFHPKYARADELDRMVKEAKQDSWVALLKAKNSWHLNPELPVLSPWRTTRPINTRTWVMERNPYSIWVDSGGNQLPYIDRISMTLAENAEIVNLRAMAGEYDVQVRHMDLQKLPALLENRERGGYRVYMDPGENGGDFCIRINLAYEADREIGEWLRTADFRRALSLGIDRDQINEAFWLGTGTPGSVVPADQNKYNPGPEYRALWSTHDPARASQMLDALGLDRRDAEGYRLRKDGRGRLRIDYTVPSGSVADWARMGEMLRDQWKKIGLELNVQAIESTLLMLRAVANELQISGSSNSGSEDLFVSPDFVFPFVTNNYQGMLGIPYAKWFHSNGRDGTEPPARVRQVMELWRKGLGAAEEERIRIGKEIWKINAEDVFQIGVIGMGPAVQGIRIAKNNLGNVPARLINSATVKSPSNALPQTFYFK
jgi:peptide/nickel transport system substrate-binding protein